MLVELEDDQAASTPSLLRVLFPVAERCEENSPCVCITAEHVSLLGKGDTSASPHLCSVISSLDPLRPDLEEPLDVEGEEEDEEDATGG